MKKPSMRDIGREVGVSAVTVSKALAGKAGMSDAMRLKIIQAAKQMGYDYAGQEQPLEKVHLDIGILVPEAFFDANSFYANVYKRLVQKLTEKGHFALLELIDQEAEKHLRLPMMVENHRVRGLILLGQPDRDYYRAVTQQGLPAVYLDFYDEQACADAVVGDNSYGCYRLTSHLIKNGHTKIGFVGNYRATCSIMDRYLGFYRAMLSYNLPLREDWIIKDRGLDNRLLHELELPEDLPTAFVCNCDVVARRLINQLSRDGMRVPDDISVTGYDDFEIEVGAAPGISTFRVNSDAMVDVAVKSILDRCAGLQKPFGRTVIGGEPVYRQSEKSIYR